MKCEINAKKMSNVFCNLAKVFVYGFFALSTKLAKRSEAIVQQQKFSKGKSDAMNYTCCCTLGFLGFIIQSYYFIITFRMGILFYFLETIFTIK